MNIENAIQPENGNHPFSTRSGMPKVPEHNGNQLVKHPATVGIDTKMLKKNIQKRSIGALECRKGTSENGTLNFILYSYKHTDN